MSSPLIHPTKSCTYGHRIRFRELHLNDYLEAEWAALVPHSPATWWDAAAGRTGSAKWCGAKGTAAGAGMGWWGDQQEQQKLLKAQQQQGRKRGGSGRDAGVT